MDEPTGDELYRDTTVFLENAYDEMFKRLSAEFVPATGWQGAKELYKAALEMFDTTHFIWFVLKDAKDRALRSISKRARQRKQGVDQVVAQEKWLPVAQDYQRALFREFMELVSQGEQEFPRETLRAMLIFNISAEALAKEASVEPEKARKVFHIALDVVMDALFSARNITLVRNGKRYSLTYDSQADHLRGQPVIIVKPLN